MTSAGTPIFSIFSTYLVFPSSCATTPFIGLTMHCKTNKEDFSVIRIMLRPPEGLFEGRYSGTKGPEIQNSKIDLDPRFNLEYILTMQNGSYRLDP